MLLCQSKIFKMKHIIITLFLFVSISTIGNGQNTMRLDEYSISSSQLDSIINMVLCDVGDKDYINVSAERNESNIYTIYVSAFSSDCEGEGGISGLSLKMKKAGIQKTIFKINSERI